MNGTTAEAANAGMMVMMGPSKKSGPWARVGMMISLVNSFKASAMGCNKP